MTLQKFADDVHILMCARYYYYYFFFLAEIVSFLAFRNPCIFLDPVSTY